MNYWNNTSNSKRKKTQHNSKSYKPVSFMNGIGKNRLTKVKINTTSQYRFPNIKREQSKKVSFIRPVHMTPVPYLKKESIIQKRKLNPWGDVDLDGTPNQFDCNPFNVAEDGFMDVMKSIGSKVKTVAKKFIIRKELKKPETRVETERIISLEEKKQLSKRIKEKIKEMGKPKTEIQKLKELEKKVFSKEEEKEKKKLETLRKKKIKEYKKVKKMEKIAMGRGAIKTAVKLKKLMIEEKYQAGKPVSVKQIVAYAAAKKRLEREPYKKAEKRFKGTIKGTRKILEAIRRPSTRIKRVSGAGDGRGRPVGPSGTYMIEGRPVYVGEYRKWQSEQKKLAKAAEREAIVEEGVEEVPTQKIPTRRVLTTQEIQQMRIRQAQLQRPPIGNILDAPNIMRGELRIQRQQPIQTPPIQTIEQEPAPPELEPEPIQEQPQAEPSVEEEEIV